MNYQSRGMVARRRIVAHPATIPVLPVLPDFRPAVRRSSASSDQLRSSSNISAPPAPWTWLGALLLTGSSGGLGGTLIEWGYYSVGAAGTEAGWRLDWSALASPHLITLAWYDPSHAAKSIGRGDASAPNLLAVTTPILLAVSVDASGTVKLRARIGSGMEMGDIVTSGVATSTPAVRPIYESYQSAGTLAWAMLDGEVSDADFLGLPRTFEAPSAYAFGRGVYSVGRRFMPADEDPVTISGDVVSEGSDGEGIPWELTPGSARLTATY